MGLPVPSIPLTVIAGTGGPTLRWGPLAGEVNDGLVAVSETRMGEHEEHIELPVWHTFMMNDPRVREIIRKRCLGPTCPEGKNVGKNVRTQDGGYAAHRLTV